MTTTTSPERLRRMTSLGSWLTVGLALACTAFVVYAFARWSSWLAIPVAVTGIAGIGIGLFTLLLSVFDPAGPRLRLRTGLAVAVMVVEVVSVNVLTLAA